MGEMPAEPRSNDVHKGRLGSWKAIAGYLHRDVTTVQRWERREGMPVHRHRHDKRGSVFALTAELDAWRTGRSALVAELAPVAAAPADTAPDPSAADVAAIAPARSHRPVVLLAASAMLLILAAVGFLALRHRPDVGPPAISSLAVLPFRNLSGDPGQEYLAEGMTEELIGRLAGIHRLRVISHTSVLRFKDAQLSTPQLGRTLGADVIVEGSVARSGNRIRVTAQLIRASTDAHFWSETYDRDLQDALTLESQIAQSIADKVEVTVSGVEHERLAATRAVAPAAYERYLRGQFAFNLSTDKAGVEQSVGYFQDAVNLDPTFAPAYVGLAQAYTQLGMVFMGDVPGETRPKAIAAARKALELDPDIAQAHVLMANIEQEQWHWRQAEAEYLRALDLNPNAANAYAGYALWLVCQGRTDEAISWVQRGHRLDPLAVTGYDVAWILFQSHRYAEAVSQLRSVLAVQPDNFFALSTLGFVLSANGHAAEAIAPLERVIAGSKGAPAATGVLIRAYALAGRRQDALALLDDLKMRQASGYVPAAAFVNAYLGLGDEDSAFVWLDKAVREQSNIVQFLKVHPFFDPIRADPRFTALIERVWTAADAPEPIR